MNAEITPSPNDEETAAIVAAVEALWPRPFLAQPTDSPLRVPT